MTESTDVPPTFPAEKYRPGSVAVFAVPLLVASLLLVGCGSSTHSRVASRPVRSTQSITTTPSKGAASAGHQTLITHRLTGQLTVPPGTAASFASLESQLAGPVGLAVAPLGVGSVRVFGEAQTALAWSTSKVPVLVTLLHDDEDSNEVLSPEERSDATLALEQSDNAAIDALFAELEQIHGGLIPASSAMQGILREAGDQSTVINTAPNDQGFTTEGQTEWSVSGEVTFYKALVNGCLLDSTDTAYVLGLMSQVIPSERWGAGAAGYPSSVPLAFKGGWGPDSNGNYQVRQTAFVGAGDRGYVISMLALPTDGSFSEGTSMITALATWAREHLILNAVHRPAQCAVAR